MGLFLDSLAHLPLNGLLIQVIDIDAGISKDDLRQVIKRWSVKTGSIYRCSSYLSWFYVIKVA